MSPVPQAESVVLPQASFGLLAAGPEGAVLLQELGIGSAGFDEQLDALLAGLRASDEAESEPLRDVVERISGLAARARGRLTISGLVGSAVPSYIFRVDDAFLVARPVGPTIEWLLLGLDQLHLLVADLVRPDNAVLVSAAFEGEDRAAFTVAGGEVSLAARGQSDLHQLEAGATRGLVGVVGALVGVLDGSRPTK